MVEIVLPDDLLPEIAFTSGDAYCLSYQSSAKTSIKTKITLDCHLFSFLLEGEKSVIYGGGTEKITPSHFLFLPSGNCLMSEKTASNGAYSSVLLFCGHELMGNFFQEYFTDVPAACQGALTRQPIAIPYDTYLQGFVTLLKAVPTRNIPATKQLLRLKFKELLLSLCSSHPDLVPYFKALCQEWTEENQLRQVVYAHVDSQVTIPELAFLCNMSLSTFKRKFFRIFETSPKQWLLQQRMERAAVLLKNDGLKASEIYMQLGYENLSSFIQSFKQHFGTTPKQYQFED